MKRQVTTLAMVIALSALFGCGKARESLIGTYDWRGGGPSTTETYVFNPDGTFRYTYDSKPMNDAQDWSGTYIAANGFVTLTVVNPPNPARMGNPEVNPKTYKYGLTTYGVDLIEPMSDGAARPYFAR